MNIFYFHLWALAASLSLDFSESGAAANVAADGNCNIGNQVALNRGIQVEDAFLDENKTYFSAGSDSVLAAPVPAQRLDSVGSEMGVPQAIDAARQDEIFQKIADARYYMINEVNLEEKYAPVREHCKNHHENCAFWAVVGECEANPGYMKTKCAPVCQSCEFLSIDMRCPRDPDVVDALQPGDITKIFNRILSNPELQQYEPVVVSRPDYAPGDTPDTADYKIGPWMLFFENAMSDEEAERLIGLGGIEGYARSADVGRKLADGTYDKKVYAGRTSTNAWCQNECYEDPVAKRVMQRVENITGIPETNSEWLQLLRYEKNQHYNQHHDLIPHQQDRQCGVRIFTLYFYLNDVEEGGETSFPALNITVKPKRGRAALWPSVYDHDPNQKDPRTEHAALPVKQGIKYGANAWIHQRDFKGPHRIGCV